MGRVERRIGKGSMDHDPQNRCGKTSTDSPSFLKCEMCEEVKALLTNGICERCQEDEDRKYEMLDRLRFNATLDKTK